jgi:hypothetical protein
MSTEFGPGPIAPRFSAGVPAEKYRPSVPAPDSDHTLKAVRPGLQIVRRQRVDQLGSESWASRQGGARSSAEPFQGLLIRFVRVMPGDLDHGERVTGQIGRDTTGEGNLQPRQASDHRRCPRRTWKAVMRCERCGANLQLRQRGCMPCWTRWKARLALVKAGCKADDEGLWGCLIQLKPSIALKFL